MFKIWERYILYAEHTHLPPRILPVSIDWLPECTESGVADLKFLFFKIDVAIAFMGHDSGPLLTWASSFKRL